MIFLLISKLLKKLQPKEKRTHAILRIVTKIQYENDELTRTVQSNSCMLQRAFQITPCPTALRPVLVQLLVEASSLNGNVSPDSARLLHHFPTVGALLSW
jgi:hypothetical protein